MPCVFVSCFSSSLISYFDGNFFSLLPPQLRASTLFPYTTLFRSHVALPALERGVVDEEQQHVLLGVLGEVLGRAPREGRAADRKSTRLNSSHRCISYAVFCLKKKITNQTKRITSISSNSLSRTTS